jgi:hypothetical protein
MEQQNFDMFVRVFLLLALNGYITGCWLPMHACMHAAGPDGPSCLSDLFSLDESGLLSSSKGGQEDEQEAAAARLSQLLGPSLRALYLASPALHTSWAISQEVGRASTRHRRGRLPQQGTTREVWQGG